MFEEGIEESNAAIGKLFLCLHKCGDRLIPGLERGRGGERGFEGEGKMILVLGMKREKSRNYFYFYLFF